MIRNYLLLLVLMGFAFNSYSQKKSSSNQKLTEEQLEVMEVINGLFDGMRESDSAKVHSSFRDNVTLYTSFTSRDDKPILHQGNLEEFLAAVGTPHDVVWNEPIWNYTVHIDGNLANVWTQYAFYAGENFSHCGVDAFMLNNDENGWKIFHLTDTRKRQDCEIPENLNK